MTDAPSPADPWLLLSEATRPGSRAVLALLAVLPLWGAWDLVARPWPAALVPGGWPALLVGLGALGLGGTLAALAVLLTGREVRVDPAARRVIERRRLRLLPDRLRVTDFAEIEEVAVRKDYDGEGADRLMLALILRGRALPRALLIRPAAARPELEALAARLRAMLQA